MAEPIHPNFERHSGDWHEYSTDTSDRYADGRPIEGTKPQRLFVRVEDADGLIVVVQARVTSYSAEARELEGGQESLLVLSRDLAEWLRDSLAKALDRNAAEKEPS